MNRLIKTFEDIETANKPKPDDFMADATQEQLFATALAIMAINRIKKMGDKKDTLSTFLTCISTKLMPPESIPKEFDFDALVQEFDLCDILTFLGVDGVQTLDHKPCYGFETRLVLLANDVVELAEQTKKEPGGDVLSVVLALLGAYLFKDYDSNKLIDKEQWYKIRNSDFIKDIWDKMFPHQLPL